ncbi:MAG: cyclic-di-AMP receptor [Anaerolineales bacterium]|nr:cyclic-di-AMP receptor [Anaerolineales bacterium]
MKRMIMAIIPRDHANQVLMSLVDAGFATTYGESRGGMLRQSQQSIFLVVNPDQVEDALAIIRRHCRSKSTVEGSAEEETQEPVPVTAELGGAVVFVWNVERMENY